MESVFETAFLVAATVTLLALSYRLFVDIFSSRSKPETIPTTVEVPTCVKFLYKANMPDYLSYSYRISGLGTPSELDWHGRLYTSCEAAFKASKGKANVKTVKCIVFGNKAYVIDGIEQKIIHKIS